jgi:glutamate-1-semialdehyde 2,1-aminomutase
MSPDGPDAHAPSAVAGEVNRLAGGVSSNFRLDPRPDRLLFRGARGPLLFGADGRTYIDYALGMGPVILGHAPERVIGRVAETLKDGQLYAGQHESELRLAERITALVPCAEKVRFSSSGSEAIQAALRLARAATGRRLVVKFEGHYHGWFDNIYVGVRPEIGDAARGARRASPETLGQNEAAYRDVRVLPWNDPDVVEATLSRRGRDVAAIIMEPILCNTGVIFPRPGYLERVRELCDAHGVVLVFDEVITGFRVGIGGAQAMLGVTPDLAVFAKAMAGGFPISCLAGRVDLMELIGNGDVMHGGTYNSNVVATVAALATIEELSSDGCAAYGRMADCGERLMRGLRGVAEASGVPMLVQGVGQVFNTSFTHLPEVTDYRDHRRADAGLLARFVDSMMEGGARVTPRGTWFLSTAHSGGDVDRTLAAAERALDLLGRPGQNP